MNNLQHVFGDFPDLVNTIADNILSYALILVSIATVTMALVEMLKSVFRIRLFFNERYFKYWIKDHATYKELVFLCIGDAESANPLFDQSIEKLMAQVQAAASLSAEFPDYFPKTYQFFTYPEQKTNLYDDSTYIYFSGDAEIWAKFVRYNRPLDNQSTENNSDKYLRDASQAKERIDHFVARKLDSFQNMLDYRWARLNQYFAVAGASLFLIFILMNLGVPIFYSIILAFSGGMIAPFAKDVVSVLSGLRIKR